MKKSLFAMAVSTLISATSMAGDILFIDVNNVIPEIKTVREYLSQAQAAGRETDTRLVIVPSYQTFSVQQRSDLERASLRFEKLMASGGNYDEIGRLGQQIRTIKTGNPSQEYRLEQLVAELQTVVNDPSYHFDRVLISGHHSPSISGLDGVLGGEFLNGFSANVAKSILNGAPATRGVHSLALLGCFTGTREMMGQDSSPWASVLPQTLFKFGYNNPAPLKTDPINLDLLRRVLSVQSQAGVLAKSGAGDSQISSLVQQMLSIPTQGRFLGFRLGQQYLQNPARH